MMRIAIDARMVSHPQFGGFKSYTTNLVKALLNIDSVNQYDCYIDRALQRGISAEKTNAAFPIIEAKQGPFSVPLREQILLPLRLRSRAPSVVHFPCATGAIFTTHPTVVTIHDAIELIERPQLKPPYLLNARKMLMNLYTRLVQEVVARNASVVVTDSNHAKHDLITALGIPEEKIEVVPIAYNRQYRKLEMAACVPTIERFNLPESYVFGVASAAPRKNSRGLLTAYAQLPEQLRSQHPLVLLAANNAHRTHCVGIIDELELGAYVRFVTDVDNDALAVLYNCSTAFVFPSLYEGFGLTVLEAMACGTPVITSNTTSIPEVAGEAAILVDPADVEQISCSLRQLLESPERRKALAAAGLARAQEFSWERTAEQMLAVYRKVAESYS